MYGGREEQDWLVLANIKCRVSMINQKVLPNFQSGLKFQLNSLLS